MVWVDKMINHILKPPSLSPARWDALQVWLGQVLPSPVLRINAMVQDASDRRYFRVYCQCAQSFVLMDAPSGAKAIHPFQKVASMLYRADVRAPVIHAACSTTGFLLQEDCGNRMFAGVDSQPDAMAWYRQAIDRLLKMQAIPAESLPAYSADLLYEEMDLAVHWFRFAYQGLCLTRHEKSALYAVFDNLVVSALQQPWVFVHRDYHSRNIMMVGQDLAVLDFQDAVTGPITYDVVSLIKDAYCDIAESNQRALLQYFFQRAGLQAGPHTGAQLLRWFDLMGVQRHLKCLGIFARLHIRDGKSRYLQSLPRVCAYLTLMCDRYPELAPLRILLSSAPSEGAYL